MPRKSTPRRKAAKTSANKQPKILFQVEGKMSTFGGPHDLGMNPTEDLALLDKRDLEDPKLSYLFLPASPPGTSGLGRRLNPDQNYLACRWNYAETPKDFLRNNLARVENPQNGRAADGRPVDWGPDAATGRVADLSPGLADALGLNTDDLVRITIMAEPAIPVKSKPRKRSTGQQNRARRRPGRE
jgi:hypothetical protein